MKQIVCLLQGVTDGPLEDLGGLTPLQKARHPALDALATRGEVAALIPPQNRHGEVALEASLYGLLARTDQVDAVSRGALEAYAQGHRLTAAQAAFAFRFVGIGAHRILEVGDELLSDNEGKAFCSVLNTTLERHGLYFQALRGPRGVVLGDHPALLRGIGEPRCEPVRTVGSHWMDRVPGGRANTALIEILQQCRLILAQQEINRLREELEEVRIDGLLLYQGGKALEPKSGVDNLSRALLVTSEAVSAGVAHALGMPCLLRSNEVRKYDYLAWLFSQLDAFLTSHDLLVVEIPYLWRSSYEGRLLEKVKGIEFLDRMLIAPLTSYCDTHGHGLSLLPLCHTDICAGCQVRGDLLALRYRPAGQPSERRYDENLLRAVDRRLPLADGLNFLLEQVR